MSINNSNWLEIQMVKFGQDKRIKTKNSNKVLQRIMYKMDKDTIKKTHTTY